MRCKGLDSPLTVLQANFFIPFVDFLLFLFFMSVFFFSMSVPLFFLYSSPSVFALLLGLSITVTSSLCGATEIVYQG